MSPRPISPAQEAPTYPPEADSFDLRSSLGRLRQSVVQRAWLITMVCVFTLGMVLLYLKTFPPIFEAEVIVVGERDDDAARNNYYSFWHLFRKGDLKSEPELMTSTSLARRVVEDLNLKFDDVHHSFLMQLGYLWQESWPGRGYRSVKEWVFPPDPAEFRPTPEQIDRARTIEAFKKSMVLEPIGNTTIGRLVVRAPTYRAGEFANKVIEIYLKQRRELATDEATTAFNSLNTETTRASRELVKAEAEKLAFDQRNSLSFDFEKDKVLVGKWGDLRTSIGDLEASIASAAAGLAVVEQQLRDEQREVISGRTLQESHVRGLLQSREFEQTNNLQQLRERYVATSPEVAEAERLLAETRAALAREPEKVELSQSKILNPAYQTLRQQKQTLRAQLASSRATLAKRREEFAVLSARMDALPALYKTAHEMARQREALEQRSKLLTERLMMADVSRATAISAPASLRVVDKAETPMRASWPNLKLLLPAALAVGLLLGVGAALIADLLSAKVTRGSLAARRGLPIYAEVHLRSSEGAAASAGRDDPHATEADTQSALARLRPLA